MQLPELKNQLLRKQVQPLYIFTGEEVAIMDIYIKKIVEAGGTNSARADSLSSIFGKLQNNSFLNIPYCYIVRDDKEYLAQEKVWDSLNNGSIQGKNIIILIYTNLDKRSKFYKHHTDMLTEFDKLSAEVLSKYIMKDIGLEKTTALIVAELCDCNYSRILLECDKIKHLANANGIDIDAAGHVALSERLIYTSPKDVIFEFIDAACKREITRSYKLLSELKDLNENPLAIINLLYANFRGMLLVITAGNGEGITNRTGLTPWQVKLAKEKGHHYSIGELVKAIRLIRETEKDIKTGLIESEISVDYILSNIL